MVFRSIVWLKDMRGVFAFPGGVHICFWDWDIWSLECVSSIRWDGIAPESFFWVWDVSLRGVLVWVGIYLSRYVAFIRLIGFLVCMFEMPAWSQVSAVWLVFSNWSSVWDDRQLIQDTALLRGNIDIQDLDKNFWYLSVIKDQWKTVIRPGIKADKLCNLFFAVNLLVIASNSGVLLQSPWLAW